MTIALLTIGTELTRGDLHNTNSGWLAEQLSSLGHEVTHMLSVDDNDSRICQALRLLSVNHEVIISTGGLGPTTDDRTTQCAAHVLGVELERSSETLSAISKMFSDRGRVMAPSNAKQADFPQGAQILPNQKGTAPGFSVLLNGCKCFFLPGVPAEMKAMFEQAVLPALPKRGTLFTTVRLRTFGIPEAEANDLLAGVEENHGITIGYRASASDLEVKILAQALADESEQSLNARAQNIADEVATRLGAVVYSRGSAQLPEIISQKLRQINASLSLAESCTGGLVSQWITSLPGASEYYKGGVVSYSNTAKSQILGVSETMLRKYGAVSEQVAYAMADGARRIFGTSYALSLTGVAGPTGGTKDKPVGLVHFAISGPKGTMTKQRVFAGDRSQIQHRAAMSGLFLLYQILTIPVPPQT